MNRRRADTDLVVRTRVQKSNTKKDLSSQIIDAVENNNIEKLYELKDLCDRIHFEGEEIDYELPHDSLYDAMIDKLEEFKSSSKDLSKIMPDGNVYTNYIKHQTMISEMWMGSVDKTKTIPNIDDCIMMPKYDGNSCSIRIIRDEIDPDHKFIIEKVETRGRDKGLEHKSSDITNKFKGISEPLLNLINSHLVNDIKIFSNDFSFSSCTKLIVRGEVVMKQKDNKTCPATFASGKVNSKYLTEWSERDNLIFKPFELTRLYYSDTIYIPTQEEAVEFLSIYHKRFKPLIEDNIYETYEEFTNTLQEPLDGVVYCSNTWKYPIYKEQTMKSVYGKYGWKKSMDSETTAANLSVSLGHTGVISYVLNFLPVKINFKDITSSSISVSKLLEYNNLGPGSKIYVSLNNGAIPFISGYRNVKLPDEPKEEEVIIPQVIGRTRVAKKTQQQKNIEFYGEIIPFKIHTHCPWCGEELLLKKTKSQASLKCVNDKCPEIIKKKLEFFVQTIGIHGIKERTLENKLSKMDLEHVFTEIINKKNGEQNSIIQILKNVSTENFLIGLGVITKAKVNSYAKTNKIDITLPLLVTLPSFAYLFIEEESSFVSDTMKYILKCIK